MAWLASVRDTLLPLLYNGGLTLVLALLTVGLAWGIQPAVEFLCNRFGVPWRGVVSTLVQIIILCGGMVLIVVAVGGNALLILLTVGLAFIVGTRVGGDTLLADYIATRRIRLRKPYQVGDEVTLVVTHRGIVTRVSGTQTHLESPEQTTVVVRNSQALRNPIVVHRAGNERGSEQDNQQESERDSEQNPAPSIPVTNPNDAAPNEAAVLPPLTGEVEQTGSSQPLDRPPQTTAPAPQDDAEPEPAALLASDPAHGEPEPVADLAPDAADADVETVTTESSEQPPEPVMPQSPIEAGALLSATAVPLTKRPVLGRRSARELR